MDLHYSQTDENIVNSLLCFTTLWIYTTLKLETLSHIKSPVLLPYGFTLLSNVFSSVNSKRLVLLPYGFTLLSNLKFQSTFFAFRQQISGIQESKRRHYIASGNHKAALLYHYFFVSATISHKSLSITETFSSGSL